MEFLKNLLCGMAIGIANVIPGLSGSTIAVVLNIYDKFVDAITLNIKKLIANRKFVIPIVLGMGIGILLFSKLMKILTENFPTQVNLFFTGIIIGTISLVYKYCVDKIESKKLSTVAFCIIAFALGLCVMIAFFFLQTNESSLNIKSFEISSINSLTFSVILRLFVGGIFGALAMIIPGISGSFIMVILGIYTTVISSVAKLLSVQTFVVAFLTLVPVGVGCLIGLLGGAKAISILLKKFPNQIYSAILGLIVGSVLVIFPFNTITIGFWNIFSYVVCTALGFSISFFSSKK